MSTERKVQVARELAGSLDAAGINYAFIHGLERFPAAMGRDLDLLVQHDQMDRAVLGAMRHFRGQKWHFVAHRRLNGHYWCFVAPPDRRIVCEFDLIPCLRWGPAILVDRPHPVAGIEHFKTDPWASFVKRLLLQLLSGNTAKLHKRPEELVIADVERAVVRRSLADFVGEGLSTSLIRAIELRDFDALPSLIPSLRRAVVLRSIRQHPGAALGSVLDWARNEFAASPLAKPIVPILGIVGVDGVGKSSLLHHVEREIRARLPVLDVQTRHWRPRILPSLGRLVGKTTASLPRPWPVLAYRVLRSRLLHWRVARSACGRSTDCRCLRPVRTRHAGRSLAIWLQDVEGRRLGSTACAWASAGRLAA
jgi:hypothetical protein